MGVEARNSPFRRLLARAGSRASYRWCVGEHYEECVAINRRTALLTLALTVAHDAVGVFLLISALRGNHETELWDSPYFCHVARFYDLRFQNTSTVGSTCSNEDSVGGGGGDFPPPG